VGEKQDVRIPPKLQGLPVTGIGKKVFEDEEIVRVTIPNSVTTIGERAFTHNYLTSIVIPNSVTAIEKHAFAHNRLTSVDIPNSVTTIEEMAFFSNQLSNIVIPNTVIMIGKHAFAHNRLTGINIPNTVIAIEGGAFFCNQLTSVVIPNSVTTIGDYAFAKNQLAEVIIPNSVTAIGEGAFILNQLTEVIIPNSVTTIDQSVFNSNRLISIVIPSSVTEIGSWAFSINQLTSITIGANVNVPELRFPRFAAFDDSFDAAYESAGKTTGTYIFSDGEWTLLPALRDKIAPDEINCVANEYVTGFSGWSELKLDTLNVNALWYSYGWVVKEKIIEPDQVISIREFRMPGDKGGSRNCLWLQIWKMKSSTEAEKLLANLTGKYKWLIEDFLKSPKTFFVFEDYFIWINACSFATQFNVYDELNKITKMCFE
jgi:hypothetical protein